MVEILDETQAYPSAERLSRALARLMEALGAHAREVTVVLCDDSAIRRRNREGRGEDAPTDVLSYPSHEPFDLGFPEVPHLGDIFISLQTAARQAEDLESEVAVLAAHGLMHLLGYDHETEEAWRAFENAQKLMLNLLEDAGSTSSS